MLSFVESFAPIQKLGVVSCQTNLIEMYERKGYSVVNKEPINDKNVPNISRNDIAFVIMMKNKLHYKTYFGENVVCSLRFFDQATCFKALRFFFEFTNHYFNVKITYLKYSTITITHLWQFAKLHAHSSTIQNVLFHL